MGKEALCVLNFSQTLFKTILSQQIRWIKFENPFCIFSKVIAYGKYEVIVLVLISKGLIENSNDYICIGLSNSDWLIRLNFEIWSNYDLLSMSWFKDTNTKTDIISNTVYTTRYNIDWY